MDLLGIGHVCATPIRSSTASTSLFPHTLAKILKFASSSVKGLKFLFDTPCLSQFSAVPSLLNSRSAVRCGRYVLRGQKVCLLHESKARRVDEPNQSICTISIPMQSIINLLSTFCKSLFSLCRCRRGRHWNPNCAPDCHSSQTVGRSAADMCHIPAQVRISCAYFGPPISELWPCFYVGLLLIVSIEQFSITRFLEHVPSSDNTSSVLSFEELVQDQSHSQPTGCGVFPKHTFHVSN